MKFHDILTWLGFLLIPSPLHLFKKGDSKMDLVSGNVGPETKVDVAFAAGKLVVSVNYEGAQAGASLSLSVDSIALLEALKLKLNGAVASEIIDVIEGALKL